MINEEQEILRFWFRSKCRIHDSNTGKRFGKQHPNMLIPPQHNIGEMTMWCNANIGRNRWELIFDRFYFMDESDLLWFQFYWTSNQNSQQIF